MAAFGFSEKNCKRIDAAVKANERDLPQPRGREDHSVRSFRAKITAVDASTPKKYSWKIVYMDGAGAWIDLDPAITGAANAFEANGRTAAVGDVVEMELANYTTGTPTPVYLFWVGGAQLIHVHVTAAASGGGKYDAKSYSGAPVVAPTGNLAASDLGTLSGTTDCLVLNMQEVGAATHELTAGSPVVADFVGWWRGMTAEATPRKIVYITGIDSGGCTEA
jgi:hypothetical protein